MAKRNNTTTMLVLNPRTCRRLFLALCLCGLPAGCGQDDLKLYPVSGKVLLQGKPLTGVGQGSV